MVSGGLLAVWAVHLTDALRIYAPTSYVVAGIGAFLAIGLANALRIFAKDRSQIIRFRQIVHDTHMVNPVDDTYRRQRIRLIDLAPPIGGAIRNKTFIECEIVGPANALFMPDCFFQNCGGEGVDGLMIRQGSFARNGFAFENCTFRACRFYLFTFMVPEELYSSFATYDWRGINWLTSHPGEAEPELPMPEITAKPKDSDAQAP